MFGGVYADIDVEAALPLDDLLDAAEAKSRGARSSNPISYLLTGGPKP